MNIFRFIKSFFIQNFILTKKDKAIPFYFESAIPLDEFISKLKENIPTYQAERKVKYSGWVNKGHMKLYINFLNDDEGILHSEFEVELSATYFYKSEKTVIEGHIYADKGVSSKFYYFYFSIVLFFIICFLFPFGANFLNELSKTGIGILTILAMVYFFIRPYKKFGRLSSGLFLSFFEKIK